MNSKDPVEIYEKLLKNMPSIGFLNRKKRIRAFVKVTNMAQELIDEGNITEEEALFVLSIMTKKSNDFRKAGLMSAMSLANIQRGVLKKIGFQYANEIRCNLSLHPVDETEQKP